MFGIRYNKHYILFKGVLFLNKNHGINNLLIIRLGIPQPMYRWLKNGVPLGDYSSELFYKIHNTQQQDAGSYQCIAKNDVGAIFSEKNNIVVACK